jgi:hypothetical protein
MPHHLEQKGRESGFHPYRNNTAVVQTAAPATRIFPYGAQILSAGIQGYLHAFPWREQGKPSVFDNIFHLRNCVTPTCQRYLLAVHPIKDTFLSPLTLSRADAPASRPAWDLRLRLASCRQRWRSHFETEDLSLVLDLQR